MKRPTVIVLAGGRGTRLASLFPELPKPLVPMIGEPFLHWLVLWLFRQGCTDYVFSLGYRGEQILEWLRASPLMASLTWQAWCEERPLGTGGGARGCLDLCSGDVLVTNGDSLIMASLQSVWAAAEDASVDGVLMGLPLKDASRYGTLDVDQDGSLIGFQEKRSGGGLVNTGLYFFREHTLARFPVNETLSMECDVIPALIREKANLRVIRTPPDAPFIDIGTPETVTQGEDFVRRHILQG